MVKALSDLSPEPLGDNSITVILHGLPEPNYIVGTLIIILPRINTILDPFLEAVKKVNCVIEIIKEIAIILKSFFI